MERYDVEQGRVKDMRCPYYKFCKYADKQSFTCNNGGGRYCGVYREYSGLRGLAVILFFMIIILFSFVSLVSASGSSLVLGTDIKFFLPANGTTVSWSAPLTVNYFNLSVDAVTFVNASFDGVNARTFTLSVAGGNASIVAITREYVEVVVDAPAGTVSRVAFMSDRPVLTVRTISGGAEEVMQDSEYFRDRAAWLRAGTPATLLAGSNAVEVKVTHHSPVTIFFYFIKYSPPQPAAQAGASGGGGGGGAPINPPVTPLPAPPQGLPPAANVGLGIIIMSVAGAALYSEIRKRRKIPTLFRARYKYKPVKWGKRTKKWWEE